MFFNVIFDAGYTRLFIFLSLLDGLGCWALIVHEVKYYNGKAFRKSAYKRKILFAKFFLRGLEDLTSKFNIIMIYINNILCIIFLVFGILNLCFYLPIFSDAMLIFGIMQIITGTIIQLENDAFVHYRSKR